MPEQNPSIISHVSVGTANYDAAVAFYDKVMSALGITRLFHEPDYKATAYGRQFPEFWVQAPHDGGAPTVGNGYHVAFLADGPEAVDAFYHAAIEAGATCDGKPGPRPQYSEAYYDCFVRDLDGHKIEAMFWDETIAPMDAKPQ